ncbi:MAG: L-threonylcarbamoyladenylate synthase [Flavobacteriales bacterium]|jgi:L-threonylcarbamoyladenylate synthase|nr:L-threonylcarbamoyladenylate synthase [Flavobacteriales bacterium]
MERRFEKEDLAKAVKTCQEDGVILYPTDTIWGLGCAMESTKAFEKLYQIKSRDLDKKCILLFFSEIQLERHFEEIPEVAWELMDCYDTPLTLILEGPKGIPAHLVAKDNTVAVRLVKDKFCQFLIQKLKQPILSTSANVSGNASPKYFDSIDEKIKSQVDYIVAHKQDLKEKSKASTIIKLMKNGEINIIRK